MKFMPGKTTRDFCLKCMKPGEITGYSAPMVSMECPECGGTWKTISAFCANCRTHSGRPYHEECPNCKNIKKDKDAEPRDTTQANLF